MPIDCVIFVKGFPFVLTKTIAYLECVTYNYEVIIT